MLECVLCEGSVACLVLLHSLPAVPGEIAFFLMSQHGVLSFLENARIAYDLEDQYLQCLIVLLTPSPWRLLSIGSNRRMKFALFMSSVKIDLRRLISLHR